MRWKCHPNHAGALPTLDGREWIPPALAITLYYPNTPTSRWRPTCEDGGTGCPAGSCRSSCSRQGAGYIRIYVDELWDRDKIREIMDHRRILLLHCRNVFWCIWGDVFVHRMYRLSSHLSPFHMWNFIIIISHVSEKLAQNLCKYFIILLLIKGVPKLKQDFN